MWVISGSFLKIQVLTNSSDRPNLSISILLSASRVADSFQEYCVETLKVKA